MDDLAMMMGDNLAQDVLDNLAKNYNVEAFVLSAGLCLILVFAMAQVLSAFGKLWPARKVIHRVLHDSEWLRTAVAIALVVPLVAWALYEITEAMRAGNPLIEEAHYLWWLLGGIAGGALAPLVIERLLGWLIGAVAKRFGLKTPEEDPRVTGPRLRVPTPVEVEAMPDDETS